MFYELPNELMFVLKIQEKQFADVAGALGNNSLGLHVISLQHFTFQTLMMVYDRVHILVVEM